MSKCTVRGKVTGQDVESGEVLEVYEGEAQRSKQRTGAIQLVRKCLQINNKQGAKGFKCRG